MVVLLVVLAIVVAGLPLAAVVLVTLACRQEETALSMAGRAPGQLARAARRLLAFSAVGISRPARRAPGEAGRRGGNQFGPTTAGPDQLFGPTTAGTDEQVGLTTAGPGNPTMAGRDEQLIPTTAGR
jgi:hypothetical protein